jgi:pimeloyl-ACP methyl ester carboxylesterase
MPDVCHRTITASSNDMQWSKARMRHNWRIRDGADRIGPGRGRRTGLLAVSLALVLVAMAWGDDEAERSGRAVTQEVEAETRADEASHDAPARAAAVAAADKQDDDELDADELSDGRIFIERDPNSLVTRIIIEAREGEVAWADVLAGLARAKGYDDSAFDDLPRRKSFALDRRGSRVLLALTNALLPSGMRLASLPPSERGGEPRLEITLDRVAVLASKRRFAALLRNALVDRLAVGRPTRANGLHWPEPVPAGAEAVVVLHGLQSSAERHTSLSDDLRQLGLRVGEFSYPGDQPIEDSARSLAAALRDYRREHPDERLRLVALSMGGLVARRAVEDTRLDPGNVAQLVLLAPPNHGSTLAYLGFAMQIWEFLDAPRERRLVERFYETVEDGLGQATDDLQPDSVFLHELNGFGVNPKVQYSILLGSGAMLGEETLAELRRQVARAAKSNRFARFIQPQLDRVLADGDELVRGKGDGVVAVKRGRLEGVEDTVVLDFDHLSLGLAPRTAGERKLRAEILKRVGEPLAAEKHRPE